MRHSMVGLKHSPATVAQLGPGAVDAVDKHRYVVGVQDPS